MEAGLRALLDYGTAGAAVLDSDRRHVFVTRDYEEAHGQTVGTMLGGLDADLLPPDAIAERARAAETALTAGRARFEYGISGHLVCGDVLDLSGDNGAAPRLGVVLRAFEHDDLQPTDEIRKRLHDAERRGRIGSWTWDLRTDLVQLSEELARIYGGGHTPDGLGEPVPLKAGLSYQHPADRDMVEAALLSAAASSNPFAFEHRIITRENRLRWMHCQGTVETDAAGQPVRVRGTDQDITERRVLREQLSRLHRRSQLILESISEGIVGLDRSARITFANDAALRMLGVLHDELDDVALVDALRTPEPADGDHPIPATLADERERHVERALLVQADGGLAPVDFTVTPLRNRRPEGAVVVLRDRGLRDRYEQEIDRTLAALAEADAHRARLLASLVAAQELERRRIAGEIHDDAVQAMSAIALRAEQLAASLDPVAAGRLRRLQDDVRDATARLRQLLVTLQPVELVTAVGSAIEAFLVGSTPPFAHVLDDRLHEQPSMAIRVVLYRIAQEALRNVVKHADATTVHVGLEDAPGDRVRMTIVDDGAGAPPEVLHDAQPGHLGLDTMRYRAELAGGRCTIDSTPGHGTIVTVELPCHVAEDAPEPAR